MIDSVGISSGSRSGSVLKNISIILSTTFVFFTSIQLMASGFGHMGQTYVTSIIEATSNPFIGLFIGLLVTAIIQSSSTTTSMAVALVASGSFSLEQAIPIIIGANIGTTITSTIVSLSYITKTAEFRKAIAAGTVHDLYNIMLVILILPLELKYQVLTRVSYSIANSLPLYYSGNSEFGGISKYFVPIGSFSIETFGAIFTVVLSFILLFTSVKMISSLLYNRWIGNAKQNVDKALFNKKYKSFGSGLVLTSIVQSSSLTTSLMVPLVATGKVKLKRAFEFILGANLGTTITAILAALFKSEEAMTLAIAHFLFNFTGVVLFLNISLLEKLATYIADRLGFLTLRNRITGFIYILFTFFLIPFCLIYFSSNSSRKDGSELMSKKDTTEKRISELED